MNIADELFYNGKKYVKLNVASKRLGLSDEALDKECRQKKLEAERIADQWFVLESSLSRLLPTVNQYHPGYLQSSTVTLAKLGSALTGLIGVLAYLTLLSIMPSQLLNLPELAHYQLLASSNEALKQGAITIDQTAGRLAWGAEQLAFTSASALTAGQMLLIEAAASAGDQALLLGYQSLFWFESRLVLAEALPADLLLTKERLVTAAALTTNLGSTTAIEMAARFSDQVLAIAGWFVDGVARLWDKIVLNWSRFLGKEEALPVNVEAPMPNSNINQIQADIKEIKTGINEILRRLPAGGGAPAPSALPSQGIVVAPLASTTPEALKSRVAEMFSDQVKVNVDPSGKAGVVTPIFRDRTGDDYIFVLTPINQ